VQPLKTWKQAVERGGMHLDIVFGNKGGLLRKTVILDTDAVKKRWGMR